MGAMRRVVLVWLGLGAAACEFMRDPTAVGLEEETVAVHSVLAVGSDRVAVLLTRVGPSEEFDPARPSVFDPGTEPLVGAEVVLISGGDTVTLREDAQGFPTCFGASSDGAEGIRSSGPGCYAGRVPGEVRSGVEYRLHIRLPDGRVVQGRATPPPAPTVLGPRPHETIRVRWQQPGGFQAPGEVPVDAELPPGAAGVGVTMVPVVAFLHGARADGLQCGVDVPRALIPAEGTVRIPLPVHGLICSQGSGPDLRTVRPDSVHARLLVTAYDAAFIRYQPVLTRQYLTRDLVAQGIEGAAGLFAGQSTVARDVTLLPVD